MKGKWNRGIFALVLVLIFSLTCLQGCGSKKASESSAKPEEAAAEDVPGKEESPEAEEPEADTAEDVSEKEKSLEMVKPEAESLSDTVRWFNASYAVLTDLNNSDYTRFGGMELTESNKSLMQQLLDQWWGVTDRATADEILDLILEEGYRSEFADTVASLEEAGIGNVEENARTAWILDNFNISHKGAQVYADCYGAYLERGENCIAGWDYCCALSQIGYYYVAGYYTEEEALDKSLEIAQIAQPLFSSWDDLIDSYMWGYEYWAEESSADRRAVYADLQTRDDNPYTVDYQTTLEKTW